MYPVVTRVLREGAISPEEQASKDAAAKERAATVKRIRELAALEPWNRYLEENPDIKKWAEANPKAAEAEKKNLAGPLAPALMLDHVTASYSRASSTSSE